MWMWIPIIFPWFPSFFMISDAFPVCNNFFLAFLTFVLHRVFASFSLSFARLPHLHFFAFPSCSMLIDTRIAVFSKYYFLRLNFIGVFVPRVCVFIIDDDFVCRSISLNTPSEYNFRWNYYCCCFFHMFVCAYPVFAEASHLYIRFALLSQPPTLSFLISCIHQLL